MSDKVHFSKLPVGSKFKTEHGTFTKIRDSKNNRGGSARVITHGALSVNQIVSISHNRRCELVP